MADPHATVICRAPSDGVIESLAASRRLPVMTMLGLGSVDAGAAPESATAAELTAEPAPGEAALGSNGDAC